MRGVISGKVGQYALVLFLAVSLNFLLPRLMPGSPLGFLLGENLGTLTPAERERAREALGLNRSLPEQYADYWGDLLRGDLGRSYQRQKPVTEVLLGRLPWTLLLSGSALALATPIGTLAGALAAWRRATRVDLGLVGLAVLLESLPSFWLGMAFIALFAVQFGWLPSFGAVTAYAGYQGAALVGDVARHLILPVSVLTLITIPDILLVTRSALVTVLGEAYLQTARAKGLRERAVLLRHALRHALLPVTTVVFLNLGFLVGGATVTETVFNYPGLGRLLFDAVLARDYPLIQGCFLLLTVTVLAANLLADCVYPFLDPRLRRA